MNLPPAFNSQFIDDDGTPLSGGLLYTYVSGTTTPQVTYQSQADDAAENANPIVLDAAGRCDLWLDPTLEYSFVLQRADTSEVRTWDDVAGSAPASSAVTSVNDFTGDVDLTADNIPFTTGTSTSWFGTQPDVAAAIDAVITQADALGSGATSGTYTPTLINEDNVAATTAYVCQYSKTDKAVSVDGILDIDPTSAANTITYVGISLPVARTGGATFGAETDAMGVATSIGVSPGQYGVVFAQAAGSGVVLGFYASSAANSRWAFHFTYRTS